MNLDFLPQAFPKSKVSDLMPFFGDAFLFAQINTPDRARMFIAQAAHECQGFTVFRENMNYSATGLAKTWPNRYSTFWFDPKTKKKHYSYKPNPIALSLHRQPIAIANLTYANRNGNGSVESGDGWLFRGGGCGMTTGRANYTLADDALSLGGRLVADPDIITMPRWAVMSFAVFWEQNNVNRFADLLQVKGARRAINGGLIGYEYVLNEYNRLKKFI